MKTSHLGPQHLAVHDIAKVIKPNTKSTIKILWPSRTKLGQVQTSGNFKKLHWCCPTDYSGSFTCLLNWKSGRIWRRGISSDTGLLKRFAKALQIVLKMSIRLLSARRRALKMWDDCVFCSMGTLQSLWEETGSYLTCSPGEPQHCGQVPYVLFYYLKGCR